jgi:uncharacterized membrane protein YccC
MDIRTRMYDAFVRFDETQQRMLSARSTMLAKQREQAPDAHPAAVAYHAAKGEHQAASLLVDALHQQAKYSRRLTKLMCRVKLELNLVITRRIQVLTNVVIPDTTITPGETTGEQK